MFFSIITVCLQAEDTLEKTILSVKEQIFSDYEYLIIDGGSTDQTLEIIHKYSTQMPITIVSENDFGIYDAMNKAVKIASGDYIYFLNSGDSFYSNQVLYNIYHQAIIQKYDILYGNICFEYNNFFTLKTYNLEKLFPRLAICLGYTICHQSCFSNSVLLKERSFDTSYQYWADQEWLLYWLKHGASCLHIPQVIARYPLGGASSANQNLSNIRVESDRISQTYMPILYHLIYPLKKIIRLIKNSRYSHGS